MAFSEVREYQPGDDVRTIDWNVTARLNKPYIKVFEEERELTVMLLVDVSGSRDFGTVGDFKRDRMAEIAATLAFSTIENNDKVGVIFFSDRIEKFIPPKKGKTHVLHIIRELLSFEPESHGTNIANALQYFSNAIKRRSTAFLISDFIVASPEAITAMEKPLLIAGNRHDMHAIRLYDPVDAALPNIGLIQLHDAETGRNHWVNTSLSSVRQAYSRRWQQNTERLDDLLLRTGTNHISMRTDEDYVKKLMQLFKS